MKIAYASDFHIDFYISSNKQGPSLDKAIERYVSTILKPQPADCIVIAGDISHYNIQTMALLRYLTTIYPEVVFTVGNHDLYLVSDSQRSKYEWDSFQRVEELRLFAANEDHIHFLDGDSITINGVTIGGCPMWYNVPDIHEWRSFMNDGHLIYQGYPIPLPYSRERSCTFNTHAYYDSQVEKLNTLRNIDVFVSHVIPIIPDKIIDSRYPNSKHDIYYHSNNIEALTDTGAKYAIFGHTHCQADFVQSSIRFLASAIGYPAESLPTRIQILEV